MTASDSLPAGADLLPIQPTPRYTLHDLVPADNPTGTVITRTWNPGDMARCRRCRECRGVGGEVCTLYVDAIVPKSEAEDFSDRGFRWAGAAPAAVRGRTS